ncbi:hypothetical protein C0584_05160 [Candidatus Parcubacteria bacterium]|nr:MAG: hypothetical protein C0584_05160 [Candidatus Parcubacteria bacterium]
MIDDIFGSLIDGLFGPYLRLYLFVFIVFIFIGIIGYVNDSILVMLLSLSLIVLSVVYVIYGIIKIKKDLKKD